MKIRSIHGFLIIGALIAVSVVLLESAEIRNSSIEIIGAPIYINVKDFGAVGDGLTDDRLAIQNAINAVPSAGGTVFFPAGTYRIAPATSINSIWNLWVDLTVKSNVNLLGEGGGKSVLKADPNFSLNRFIINQEPGDSNISVKGLTFDINGTPKQYSTGSGLTFVQTSNVAINDVEIKNVPEEGFALSNVTKFYIANTLISNVFSGMRMEACSDGNIKMNRLASTAGDGIHIASIGNGPCTNVKIESNTILDPLDVGIDIDVGGTSAPNKNIVISGNVIQRSAPLLLSVGIRISDAINTIVTDNIVENLDKGIAVDTPPSAPAGVIVSKNVIKDFQSQGISARYNGLVVDGNRIYNLASSGSTIGIGLSGDYLQVTNNDIEQVGVGIKWISGGTKIIISGNTIINPVSYGISDDSSNNFNINTVQMVNNIILDRRSPHSMIRGIDFEGSYTNSEYLHSNVIQGYTTDPAIKLVGGGNQLSFNLINSVLPNGTFTIQNGTLNASLLTVKNKQVTSSSVIILTFEGDPSTILGLYVNSKTPSYSFTVIVKTSAPTTAPVSVRYIIFN